MKLYIDTTSADIIKIKLGEKSYSLEVERRSSQKLLPFIKEILEKNNLKIEDISEVVVSTGPGSYTGIRVGVSVAQTISWLQSIPLNGKKAGENSVDIKYDC